MFKKNFSGHKKLGEQKNWGAQPLMPSWLQAGVLPHTQC